MSYIQNAQTDRNGQRLANGQAFRPAYAGAFAYLVFTLAFVFTGQSFSALFPELRVAAYRLQATGV
ncbi:hypothetical protein AJ88_24340 [Mesorhizobium amorphae CCBAU 01583]|nr:hypothetical protein AJ88_24340 [Mesorhizobium amorphae CCBAU 01583]